MDARLWSIGGKRLNRLRREDLGPLADALADASQGLAKVGVNRARGITYVSLKRPGAYTLYVRGEDWERIMPFLRHSTDSFRLVRLPVEPPDPVLSPQPNRTMAPIRYGLSGGRSYMDRFPYETERQLTDLLSQQSFSSLDKPQVPARPLNNPPSNPQVTYPPAVSGQTLKPHDALDMRDEQFRRQVVELLLQLFPDDFPTSPL